MHRFPMESRANKTIINSYQQHPFPTIQANLGVLAHYNEIFTMSSMHICTVIDCLNSHSEREKKRMNIYLKRIELNSLKHTWYSYYISVSYSRFCTELTCCLLLTANRNTDTRLKLSFARYYRIKIGRMHPSTADWISMTFKSTLKINVSLLQSQSTEWWCCDTHTTINELTIAPSLVQLIQLKLEICLHWYLFDRRKRAIS